jgi:hypothetical protein
MCLASGFGGGSRAAIYEPVNLLGMVSPGLPLCFLECSSVNQSVREQKPETNIFLLALLCLQPARLRELVFRFLGFAETTQ